MLTKESGYVYNPNYPQKYQNDVDFIWSIRAPYNYQIILDFSYFDFEDSPNCENDYLSVYDGRDENAVVMKRMCGVQRDVYLQSTANHMTVRMRTNKKVSGMYPHW